MFTAYKAVDRAFIGGDLLHLYVLTPLTAGTLVWGSSEWINDTVRINAVLLAEYRP